jgi:ABC-2 type transport system ATP-binding protein
MADSPIVAERLVRRFGTFTAVDGISFDVRSGEVFGLLGGNGSGKTTTIRMLTGIMPPTSGRAIVAGVDVVADPLSVRSRLGYVAQKVSLYPNLTMLENIEFYGGIYGLRPREVRARAAEIAPRVGLEKGDSRVFASELAPGVRQRLAFLIALLHQPKVLLLDEPTASVNLLNRRELFVLMHELARSGIAVLLTSHHVDEMERCHRLAFVDKGKMIALGRNDELKQSILGGQRYAIDPIRQADSSPLRSRLTEAGFRLEEHPKERTPNRTVHVIVPTEREAKRLHQTVAELDVNIQLSPPTLESVLLEDVRRRRRATDKFGVELVKQALNEEEEEEA